MVKVGRNDPCPCKSGLKYKRCCGGPTANRSGERFALRKLDVSEIPLEVQLRALEMQRQSFAQQFGHVRQPISAEFQGHRFVVAGNVLSYSPSQQTKYFADFLATFVPLQFGKPWFDAEIAKPAAQRHPVMQARLKALDYMGKQPATAEGIQVARITGPMLSYFSFAYDLFVVKDNGRLDARLLERLKNCDQFQGARHELFAEATCLRAGFIIEHEDETDGSSRHAEFTATHRQTGQKVSVEAKSKHRPGVLGQPGLRQTDGQHNLRVGSLLNDAIAKNSPHPLAVFLDLNLPFSSATRLLAVNPPHYLITNTIERIRRKHTGQDPINILVITNHPAHYAADEDAADAPQLLSLISNNAQKPTAHPAALKAIHDAANLYGNIPQNFPSNDLNSIAFLRSRV